MKLKIFVISSLSVEDHKELRVPRERSKRKDMVKPWDGSWDFSFSLCSRHTTCRACLVFLYESYCKFLLQVVFFHIEVMASFWEDFREVRSTFWH